MPPKVEESPERRRHARVDCIAPVHIVAQERTFLGITDELSTGGLRVRCHSSLEVGERVGVRLHFSGSPGVLVDAEVVWVKPQRLALRFVRLGAAALDTLCRLTSRP